MAKKILWLSRHDMTKEQMADLKRIYGDVEVEKLDKTIKTADDILDTADGFDVLAVVLPIDLIAELFAKTDKEIITAKSERVRCTNETVFNPATNKEEPQFKFVHRGWSRYKTVKIEMEQL